MSAPSSKNAQTEEPDKQFRNFLTLKAKVIHTDELIRRYREKGQECSSLQEQLRQALGQEASLKQSLVGLRAEVSALLKEKENMRDVVTASQWEKELAETRATNAEMVVQQLTAQADTHRECEASLREERDKLAEQCSQLQEQLKKFTIVGKGESSLGISPALQFLLTGRRRRHHSFTSSFSLPTSPPLSSEPPTPFSLPSGIPHPPALQQWSEDMSELVEEEECDSQTLPERVPTPTDLDFSVSDSSSDGGEEISPLVEDDSLFESQFVSPFPSEPQPSSPLLSSPSHTHSPLVHAPADTMNSDSGSELSLSEVESLSPIPPSPNQRLPTLSPLPLSPARQTLSPLPCSPPPPHSFVPSPVPQFVSSAPNSCHVPVPSVLVTSSPPPIVSPSHLHHSTLHRSHPSPFSAASLPVHHSPLPPLSPCSSISPPPTLPTGIFSQPAQRLSVTVDQPSSTVPPPPGGEAQGERSQTQAENPGAECNTARKEAACRKSAVKKDVGNQESFDKNKKTVDKDIQVPTDDDKSTDDDIEKTSAEIENEKPADDENEKPAEIENEKPADDENEKPADDENEANTGGRDTEKSGENTSWDEKSGENDKSGDKEEDRPREVQSSTGVEEDRREEMEVSVEVSGEVSQCGEDASTAEGTDVIQHELEDGELSCEEEEENEMPEVFVLLDCGVLEDGEDSSTEEVLATPAHHTTADSVSLVRPNQLQSVAPSFPTSGPSKTSVRECTQKRRPSESLAAPRPKATRLSTAVGERGGLTQASKDSKVGKGDDVGDNNSTPSFGVESVREHPTHHTPATRVGYSTNSTPRSMGCPVTRSSSDGASLLQTDRATGQVEELALAQSRAPPTHTQSQAPPTHTQSPEEPGSSGCSSIPSDPSLSPSLLQQSLCPDLRCPLALPDWLLTSMLRVQSYSNHHPYPSRKKKSFRGGKRQHNQKACVYVGNLLERLMTGEVPLSTAVKLLSESWNCSNPSTLIKCLVHYFQTCYKPPIDHVMSTYNALCSDARSKVLEFPPSPSFPSALLRPECQLLALLYHTTKLNPSMPQLLPELATALYSAVLSPLVNFHRMAATTRLFTGVCRFLGQRERVLFLASDLLRKPLSCQELPIVTGMLGVWPAVFARRQDVQLIVEGRLNLVAVEVQPLSYALEVVVTVMMRQGGLNQHHLDKLRTLCQWGTGQTITAKTVDKLASVLLQLLQTSRRVTVEQEPCRGWFRPRPSHLTFHLVHTLRLLSWFKGWVWTSDVLIKAHVWPILQSWNSKSDSVPEATVMAVVRLLGFVGQQGAGSGNSSLAHLHKVLLSLLIRQETPLSIQLCAAESLLDLCPPSLPSSQEPVAVLWQWLRGLANHPAGPHLSREFCPKLCTAPPHIAGQSSQSIPIPPSTLPPNSK